MQQDDLIIALQAEVKKRKDEIQKINSSSFITNLTFRETPESRAIAINTLSKTEEVVNLMAILVRNSASFYQAAEILGLKKSVFKHQDHTLEEWTSDFRLKIEKIKMTNKKKKLAELESQLLELESPDLKKQRALDKIAAQLQDDEE